MRTTLFFSDSINDAVDRKRVVQYLIVLLALGEIPLQNSQEQVEGEERPP